MRKLLIGILVLVVLFIGAAAIAPFLIPSSAYQERIETAASDALGRDVRIAGDVKISLLPRIQARAHAVTIANAEGFGEESFAEIAELRASLAVLPLFARRVEVSEFVLDRPVIRLERLANGRVNWLFESADAPAAAVHASASAGAGAGFRREPGALPISELSLGTVRIIDGEITYADRVAPGAEHSLADVNLALSLPSLAEPLRLNGDMVLDGAPVGLELRLDSLRDFFEGRETTFVAALDSDLLEVSADGRFEADDEPVFAGAFTINAPDLRALAAATGAALPEGPGYERFSLSGEARTGTDAFAFDNARLVFDDIEAEGRGSLDLSGDRPSALAFLEIGTLDLRPYLPEEAETGGGETGGAPPWSEEPIDLTALSMFDATVTASADVIRLNGFSLSDAALEARLENGRLEIDIERVSGFSGGGAVTLVADARSRRPTYAVNGELENIEALELLGAFADFEKLAGRGGARFALTASGASQAEIMRSLSGDGAFTFNNGEIRGVDLGRIARGARDFASGGFGGLQSALGARETTDFSELAATFTVRSGVARTADLSMLSPLLRVRGAGDLDIGGQAVDFTLRPSLVASAEGQGGVADLAGVEVPVRLAGPWAEVRPTVDIRAAGASLGAINIGEDEDGAAVTVGDEAARLIDENVGGDLGAAISGALGLEPRRRDSAGETTADDAAADAEEEDDEDDDPLRNILGGVLGGGPD